MMYDYFNEGKDFYLMTEYAKSDRANCKGCHQKIFKDSLKFAYIYYDEAYVSPVWHHFACLSFLPPLYQKKLEFKDVYGYNNLELDDQRLIEQALVRLNATIKKKNPKDEEYDAEREIESSSEEIPEEEEDSSDESEEPQKQQVKKQSKKNNKKPAQSKKNTKKEADESQNKVDEEPQPKKLQKVDSENTKDKQILLPQKLSSWKNILKKRVINN